MRNLVFFLIIFLVSAIGWKEPEKAPVFYLIYAIAFYYYGFSFIDYVNERQKLNMDESVQFVRQNRGLAVAIGMIYSILILMPVDLRVIFSFSSFENASFFVGIGGFLLHLILWFFAATAPILAIVAATIAMNDVVDLKKR